MKTKEEIEIRLEELKSELEHLTDWHTKAHAKYVKDRDWWGAEADRNELDEVSSYVHICNDKIGILKWVIDENQD
jgi:hypothetical protein